MIVTRDDEVLSSAPCELAGLMSCTHEEVDTRLFVHASDEAEHGMKKIHLRTVDTYVVVVGISMAQKNGCDCIWFAFGTGTTFRYLNAIVMSHALGDAKCGALPACHALTECDVTSSLAGRENVPTGQNGMPRSAMYTVKNANDWKCHECSSHN